MTREPGGIRPSVLLLSALLVFGCGYGIYRAWTFDPLTQRAEIEDHDRDDRRRARADRHGRRRDGRVRSGGVAGSTGGAGWVHHDWGTETELSRALTLHLPGPTFWRDAVDRGVPPEDPQLLAMWRSFHGLAQEYGEAPPLPFEPTAHRAELVDATGDVASSPTSCDVRVLPVASGEFTCVVRVMCDGRVLYPNATQTAGYVRCEIEDGQPVRALDSGFSARDGDPLVDLDLARGTVRVEEYDEAGQPTYSATLRIQS
ncbi:MAG: hypothetical protein H6719_34860 [Sandaracinaceae bacterium]|nr:hypothetical protein [Sandaracinaceae bacterium]